MNISAIRPAAAFFQGIAAAGQQAAAVGASSVTGPPPLALNEDRSPEETREIEALKARDREVRAHEQAHLSAAGGLAMSGAHFTYERGPDGVRYATGGEVQIDTSPGQTPEETIRRAQIIRAAALAPAEPSGQDRAVAAQAARMEVEARAELAAGDEDGDGESPAVTEKAADPQLQARAAQYEAHAVHTAPGLQLDVRV